MPVFRVERNKGYTVMSNHRLRDKSLSGLCCINRESKDAIRSAVSELERAGYIERHQITDKGGKFSSNERTARFLPPSLDKPSSKDPTTKNRHRKIRRN